MKERNSDARETEKARYDYLEAQEQLLKMRERLMVTLSELNDLEKNP
jgi:hypothetical protein